MLVGDGRARIVSVPGGMLRQILLTWCEGYETWPLSLVSLQKTRKQLEYMYPNNILPTVDVQHVSIVLLYAYAVYHHGSSCD